MGNAKRFYHPPVALGLLNEAGTEFVGTICHKSVTKPNACYGYLDGASFKVYLVERGQIAGIGRLKKEEIEWLK